MILGVWYSSDPEKNMKRVEQRRLVTDGVGLASDTSSRVQKMCSHVSRFLQEVDDTPSEGLVRVQDHILRTFPDLSRYKAAFRQYSHDAEERIYDVEYGIDTVKNLRGPCLDSLLRVKALLTTCQDIPVPRFADYKIRRSPTAFLAMPHL